MIIIYVFFQSKDLENFLFCYLEEYKSPHLLLCKLRLGAPGFLRDCSGCVYKATPYPDSNPSSIPASLTLALNSCSGAHWGADSLAAVWDLSQRKHMLPYQCLGLLDIDKWVHYPYPIFWPLHCPLLKVNNAYCLPRTAVLTHKREIVSTNLHM